MDLDTFIKFYKELPGDKLVYPNSFDDFLKIAGSLHLTPKLKKKYGINTTADEEDFQETSEDLLHTVKWKNFIFIDEYDEDMEVLSFEKKEGIVDLQQLDYTATKTLPVYAYIYYNGKELDRMVLMEYDIEAGENEDSDLDYIQTTYLQRKSSALKDFKPEIERQYFQAVFNSPNHGLRQGVKL